MTKIQLNHQAAECKRDHQKSPRENIWIWNYLVLLGFPLVTLRPSGHILQLRHDSQCGPTGRHVCWPNPTNSTFSSSHSSLPKEKRKFPLIGSDLPHCDHISTKVSEVGVNCQLLLGRTSLKNVRVIIIISFSGLNFSSLLKSNS